VESLLESRIQLPLLQHGFDGFLSRLEVADYDPEAVRGRLGTAREQRGKVAPSPPLCSGLTCVV